MLSQSQPWEAGWEIFLVCFRTLWVTAIKKSVPGRGLLPGAQPDFSKWESVSGGGRLAVPTSLITLAGLLLLACLVPGPFSLSTAGAVGTQPPVHLELSGYPPPAMAFLPLRGSPEPAWWTAPADAQGRSLVHVVPFPDVFIPKGEF